MFAVTAWACVLPPLPLALVALIYEGPDRLLAPILAPSWKGWFALFYTVVPVMWLGYLIWGTLLRTYPAAKVGPISLLVPCVALGFAACWSANRSAACASWAWSSCWAAWRWASSPRYDGCGRRGPKPPAGRTIRR